MRGTFQRGVVARDAFVERLHLLQLRLARAFGFERFELDPLRHWRRTVHLVIADASFTGGKTGGGSIRYQLINTIAVA
jgi:hypothetical protein